MLIYIILIEKCLKIQDVDRYLIKIFLEDYLPLATRNHRNNRYALQLNLHVLPLK